MYKFSKTPAYLMFDCNQFVGIHISNRFFLEYSKDNTLIPMDLGLQQFS